jgi:hypothetical protein
VLVGEEHVDASLRQHTGASAAGGAGADDKNLAALQRLGSIRHSSLLIRELRFSPRS